MVNDNGMRYHDYTLPGDILGPTIHPHRERPVRVFFYQQVKFRRNGRQFPHQVHQVHHAVQNDSLDPILVIRNTACLFDTVEYNATPRLHCISMYRRLLLLVVRSIECPVTRGGQFVPIGQACYDEHAARGLSTENKLLRSKFPRARTTMRSHCSRWAVPFPVSSLKLGLQSSARLGERGLDGICAWSTSVLPTSAKNRRAHNKQGRIVESTVR